MYTIYLSLRTLQTRGNVLMTQAVATAWTYDSFTAFSQWRQFISLHWKCDCHNFSKEKSYKKGWFNADTIRVYFRRTTFKIFSSLHFDIKSSRQRFYKFAGFRGKHGMYYSTMHTVNFRSFWNRTLYIFKCMACTFLLVSGMKDEVKWRCWDSV